jgi:protease I
MPKTILMIIAPQMFRDEEYKEPKSVFEHAGYKVVTASSQPGTAHGTKGMTAKVDLELKSVNTADYDAVVFAGGAGSRNYYNDKEALRIARESASKGKVTASICSAGGILAYAGVLKGKKATVFPAEIELINSQGAIYSAEGVVRDGKIITSDGPANAKAFGEKIIEALKA